MSKLPVITGFGGVNAAGRSSFHHAYCRMVEGSLSDATRHEMFKSLASMMSLIFWNGQRFVSTSGDPIGERLPEELISYILENTLVRHINTEHFDVNKVYYHVQAQLSEGGASARISTKNAQMNIPEGWKVFPDKLGQLFLRNEQDTQIFLPCFRTFPVQSAGQIPTGFDPGKLYRSAHHPKGLQLTVYGASDALHSLSIPWEKVLEHVRPDEIGTYASSSMGQMDEESGGGYSRAAVSGKRTSTKQMAFSFPDMPADFVNAYVLGSVGRTTSNVGACATFLYNLYGAIEDIKNGVVRVAVVGSSEAPLFPENMEGYRIMGALAQDQELVRLDELPEGALPEYRRACRPFSDNCGFVLSESAQYVILFEDNLALELGANIYGSAGGVFTNADGYKQSISKPGIGNYLTIAKSCALARSVIGEKALRHNTFMHAHGTGTPQNRVTESHAFSMIAKAFGIEDWPVTAVKAYVGHPTGPASGDQLIAMLGTWEHGIIPGIKTISHIADDVYQEHLKILMKDTEIEPENLKAGFINSKGFGGNNATATLFSPSVTLDVIRKKHGAATMAKYAEKNAEVKEKGREIDQAITRKEVGPIYKYGANVNNEDLKITSESIEIPGFPHPVNLNLDNPFQE